MENKEKTGKLLEVKDLHVSFFTPAGEVKAVGGISYDLNYGEVMGIVGESGSGKSVEAYSIIGLLQSPGKVVGGSITLEGEDVLSKSKQEMVALRGNKVAMIFQNPMTCLNPVYTIGNQLIEALKAHDKEVSKEEAAKRAMEMLTLVGINNVEKRMKQYPHELSGGMRQRVMIAMGLICHPQLLIADEPTTALDVTVQKQVIKLLNDLQAKLGFAMIFVSHDLALVAEVASEITVMYAGQVIEQAPTTELLTNPIHEYTRGLLGSVLSIEEGAKDGSRLHQVPGSVPSPQDFPRGDRFAPRSSHPTLGLDVHPVIKELPGKNHRFSELPDAYLKENGLTPYLERAAATEQEVM